MLVDVIVVGALQVNCYLVGDRSTREAILIDPGDDPERILQRISHHGYRVCAILLTHAHFDHIMGIDRLKPILNAPLMMHEADRAIYDNLPQYAGMFGFKAQTPVPVDRYFQAGDVISYGDRRVTVLETPGHSPGGVSFLSDDSPPCVFTGDALFAGGVGRTDFPSASFDVLSQSIQTQLYTLPEKTVVYPGHGPSTTIGEEKRYNPFVRG